VLRIFFLQLVYKTTEGNYIIPDTVKIPLNQKVNSFFGLGGVFYMLVVLAPIASGKHGFPSHFCF